MKNSQVGLVVTGFPPLLRSREPLSLISLSLLSFHTEPSSTHTIQLDTWCGSNNERHEHSIIPIDSPNVPSNHGASRWDTHPPSMAT